MIARDIVLRVLRRIHDGRLTIIENGHRHDHIGAD